MSGRKRVAVLISGRGSNLSALIAATRDPDYPATIALVLSNRADAAGLVLAADAGIPTAVIDHRRFATRADFDTAIDASLREHDIDLVCLAGFMRLLTGGFVERWRDRMINIHPSLLPLFPGLDTHQRAIDAGTRLHGCTVHFVRAEMDSGPIIAQAAVPIAFNDTADTLSARVLGAEHQLYPLALALVAADLITTKGDRIVAAPELPPDADGILIAPYFGESDSEG